MWNAACWELYVHESLRRFGFAVKPHPDVKGIASHVDFLAILGDERVYVECVTPGRPAADVARRNGVAKLQAALDRSGVVDYWLALEIDAYGPAPVPHGRFVRELKSWLGAHDSATVDRPAGPVVPAFGWDRDGWRIRVVLIPRGLPFKGRADLRPLGVMPADEDERVTWVVMRDLLEEKASGYGRLDAAFVIALGAPDLWPDNPEAVWSVFGPHPFLEGWERKGFLLNASGRAHINVSGVLIATAVQPHTAASRIPTLYENPHAEMAPPSSLLWPRVRIVNDRPEESAGIAPHEMFALPKEWPPRPW